MEDTWYVDILLGAVNLDTRAPGSLLMTSFNYQVHPGYDPSTLANDLAIVQLPIGIDVRSSRDTPPPLITLCLRLPASYLPSVSRTLSRTPVRSPSWAGARRGTPGPGSALTSSMSRWAAHISGQWSVPGGILSGDQDIRGRLLWVLRAPGSWCWVCRGPQHMSGDHWWQVTCDAHCLMSGRLRGLGGDQGGGPGLGPHGHCVIWLNSRLRGEVFNFWGQILNYLSITRLGIPTDSQVSNSSWSGFFLKYRKHGSYFLV